MRHCPDMRTGGNVPDIADLQRDLQYNRDLLRLHHMCVVQYVPWHSDMRQSDDLCCRVHLSRRRDMSDGDYVREQQHVPWRFHLSRYEYLSGVVHLFGCIDLSEPGNLHQIRLLRGHSDLLSAAHLRHRIDVCWHGDMYGDGHNMPGPIHMSWRDHL